ncbi:hypothetical protein AC249_AIPGENE2047, partial [Exaiptasia diaphana]
MAMESEDDEMFITPSSFRSQKDREIDYGDFSLEEYLGPELFEHAELIESPQKLIESTNRFQEPQTSSRFGEPLSHSEVQDKIAISVPKNTTYKDNWAANLFEKWRKVDGTKYPHSSLHGIISAIQHFLKTKGRPVKLFNDEKFSYLRDALDTAMKDSASSGLGIKKKQAQVITLDEEDELWSKNVLGDDNHQQLLDTLLYLFGLHFALRGGMEHRRLRLQNS